MMKTIAVVLGIILLGVFVWGIGNRLSTDAIGMGVGLVFGVLAGVPTALLVMTAGRRRAERDEEEATAGRGPGPQGYGYPPYPQQAPVIVLAAPPMPQYPAAQTVDSVGYPVRPALPGPAGPAGVSAGRAFKVVGEKEEWIEEW